MPFHKPVREAIESLTNHALSLRSVDDTLATLTQAALQSIPGVDYVSISMREGNGANITTLAPTHDVAVEADQVQYELKEGPCYEAVNGEPITLAIDIAHDVRWPNFGPRAAALGIGAQMAVGLISNRRKRAAMNLYAKQADAFTDETVEMAELFASHAAVVLGFTGTIESLDEAIQSRKIIGQALGIVMERYDLSEDRAFRFLTRVSQDSNVKLRLVAQSMVDDTEARARGDKPPGPE